MIPGTDPQLSWLPYDSPASLVLRAARLLQRAERLAPELHPLETLSLIEEFSLVETRMDRIERGQVHRLAWRVRNVRGYASRSVTPR